MTLSLTLSSIYVTCFKRLNMPLWPVGWHYMHTSCKQTQQLKVRSVLKVFRPKSRSRDLNSWLSEWRLCDLPPAPWHLLKLTITCLSSLFLKSPLRVDETSCLCTNSLISITKSSWFNLLITFSVSAADRASVSADSLIGSCLKTLNKSCDLSVRAFVNYNKISLYRSINIQRDCTHGKM